ncbi:MAG: Coenzyme F420 hydrogenase/dehydrogenase, beta subunit C-terminal domain [Eubacteriales bacterium]|nr:Coenzyme F420 hydrogenase/dehydrogenase, beta subunit C-terminal domain [Eubacteriales bacterium]
MTQEGNDIRTITEERCCGCAACANACPADAISMEEGAEGFSFPVIHPDACIHCGKCLKVCPVSEKAEKEPFPHAKSPQCFAAAAEDAIRLKSSSGGIFRVLAEEILAKEGVVYGAAWEGLTVQHIRVTEKEMLARLSGSKYVQSRIGSTYRQVKEDLEQQRQVLFSGTPCQNAGLLRYLQKDYENLTTVDIVCHGVPSEKLFQAYLADVHGKENVKSVAFRTKEFGQNCANGVVTYQNGKKKMISASLDPFEKGFHKSLFLRKSCYECRYAAPPRAADFTLGDFWGLEKYNPALKDERGVSVVLLNTEKAEKMWTELSQKLSLCEKVPLETALKSNRFRKKSRRHPARERFFRLWPNFRFSDAVSYAMENRYDVQFRYQGDADREKLEASLEQIANQEGVTVCLEGHLDAVWKVSVSGLDELLAGRDPSELTAEESERLRKLMHSKPPFAERTKQKAKEAWHAAVSGAADSLSPKMKDRLKRVLKK